MLRAIIFDIDGTVYRHGQLRRAMLFRLLSGHATAPVIGYHTLRILHAYRQAQERLRHTRSTNVAEAQIVLTCERTRLDRETVVGCVRRWMEHEPLAILPSCIQPGIRDFLARCKARGLRLGALSDYPAEAKLRALNLEEFFDTVLSAQTPGIDVFKPNPRGLLAALDQLGAGASESMYIGDRIEVDAATAEAAGVQCAILTSRRVPELASAHFQVAGYAELADILWPTNGGRCLDES